MTQIKTFIQPTINKSTQNNSQMNATCHNIRSNKIPQLTRLQLEKEHTHGKIFQWKSDHPEIVKPVTTILKIESTDKVDIDQMTAGDFPAIFS